MTIAPVPMRATLYMNTRDVTSWVQRLAYRQEPWQFYQKVEVVWRGWHELEEGAKFDLFLDVGGSDARSEILLRGGVIPPDDRGVIDITTGEVIPLSCTIVDWAWVAQRRTPHTTVVIANDRTAARRIVEDHGGPIGAYTIVQGSRLSEVCTGLASAAGFWLDWRMPDVALGNMVVEPQSSYWDALWSLVEPFRPDAFFRRDRNQALLADSAIPQLKLGSVIELPETTVRGIHITPSRYRKIRRVVVEVN